MNQTSYIPGVCNIGPAEVRLRKWGGIMAAALSLVLLIILLAIKAPALWRLLLFFPIAMAAIGFLQTYVHFCVGFGMKGIYNVLKPAGEVEAVEKEAFRQADRAKAQQILLMGVVISIVLTLFLTFI